MNLPAPYHFTDEDKAALAWGERIGKTQAARMLGVSRSTLYRLIDAGRLTETQDGKINTREAYREFLAPKEQKQRRQSPAGQWRVSAT